MARAERQKEVPGRSREQRLKALAKANDVRIARARLKQDLSGGRARIDQILAQPPECAQTAKVSELLLALPKFGPARVARLLSHCRISAAKTVAGLSERQRTELIAHFRR